MKKLFSLSCLLLLTVVVCRAELRTPEQAAQLAAQYLNQNQGTGVAARRAPAAANTMTLYRTFYKQTLDLEVRDDAQSAPLRQPQGLRRAGQTEEMDAAPRQTVHIEHGDDEPALYVFNSDNGGFAVISADTRAVDLLCYCDTGTINAETLNPAFEWWLNRFVEEISSLTDEDEMSDADEDDRAPIRRAALAATQPTTTAIPPLLETVWGQTAPFYNRCPIDAWDNTRCYTGCVATAAAQIMYYWKYPTTGTGSSSYSWKNKGANNVVLQTISLSANYASTTYDWNNMLPTYENGYNTIQANAVATLMYHCGVACQMDYGGTKQGGSGSDNSIMASGMSSYFGYYCRGYITTINNTNTIAQFQSYYNEDLEAGHPILMQGVNSTTKGGHAFVCDGRDVYGRYHINWGWNGTSNCFTTLSSVAPKPRGNTYNTQLYAIIGLVPDDTGLCGQTTNTFVFKKSSELPYRWHDQNLTESGTYTFDTLWIESCNVTEKLTFKVVPDDKDGMCGDNLYWAYNSTTRTLTITGDGDMWNYSLLDSPKTTAPWYDVASDITTVILPEGMTSIGDFAFFNCSSTTNLSFPTTLLSLGEYAFGNCNGITTITLPDSLTTICNGAFASCQNLQSITIPKNVTTIYGNSLTPFYHCHALTSIVWNAIACGTASARDQTPFYDVRSQITSFVFGDEVREIPGALCYGMTNLTTITLPESLQTIKIWAFAGCTGLTSITIPKNVKAIGSVVFEDCSNLTSIVWDAQNFPSITHNSYAPFDDIKTQITSFYFGSDVATIPDSLCYGMSNITNITIPTQVTSYGTGVFYGCSSLNAVVWNAQNCAIQGTTAGYTPFYDIRTQITSFTIGNEVVSLPVGCCLGLSSLTAVTIPQNLPQISSNCFNTCTGLESIRFERVSPPTLVGNYCFNNVPSDVNAIVPCGSIPAYRVALPFTNYSTFGDNFPFTLTIGVQTEGTGTAEVTTEPDCGTNVATITATPAEHYHFVRWTDDDEENPTIPAVRNVTVTANASYTAIFEEDPKYTITVNNTDGFGSASADKASYYEGETATITVTPAAHYHFSAWSGTDSENIAQTDALHFTYTIGTTDREFTVSFAMDDNIGGNCEENDGTNLTWNYNVGSGTLTITGTGNMEDYANDSDMPWFAFSSDISTVAVTDDADQTPLFTWLTSNGGINMTLGRTLYADGYLNTLCLPFGLNAAQVQTFLPHATVYRFVQATVSNGELHIEMEPVTTISAGVPYLLRFPAADPDLSNALFSGVTITATEGQTVGTGDVTFVGVLRPTGMTSGDTNQLMVGNEDRLFWANASENMRAFRAYFQINTGSNSPLRRGMPARVVTRPEVPTGMTETNNASEATVRKYMRNGVLVIERNGECYDAQGNKLQ